MIEDNGLSIGQWEAILTANFIDANPTLAFQFVTTAGIYLFFVIFVIIPEENPRFRKSLFVGFSILAVTCVSILTSANYIKHFVKTLEVNAIWEKGREEIILLLPQSPRYDFSLAEVREIIELSTQKQYEKDWSALKEEMQKGEYQKSFFESDDLSSRLRKIRSNENKRTLDWKMACFEQAKFLEVNNFALRFLYRHIYTLLYEPIYNPFAYRQCLQSKI